MEHKLYFHQPTVSESLGNGWQTMKKYFLYLFLAVVINGIFDGGMNSARGGHHFEQHQIESAFNWQPLLLAITPAIILISLVLLALVFLIRSVISYGADLMFVQAVRDERPEIKNLFIGFQNRYVTIVLSNLLVTALVIAGFIFFVIPGIVLACRLAFVSYLVMDKGMGTIEAVNTSWNMTRGYGWTLFGLGITSVFIFIGGLLLLIVGVFPALIWIRSSFASLYQAVLTVRNRDGYPIDEAVVRGTF
jgi:uncharacterized membrane protein